MSIKQVLLNAISNSGYNVKDNDVLSALTQIINENKESIDISNKNSILCRILSQEEYNKYIINGTCDGAIEKYNINVWHNFNNTMATAYVYADDNSMSWPSNSQYSKNNAIIYKMSSSWQPGGAYIFMQVQTIKDYIDIISDNTSNNTIAFYPLGGYIEFLVFHTYWEGTMKSINLFKNAINKNAISNNKTLSASNNFTSGTINFNADLSFRPVFQYIDNNKSANIYR